MMLDDAMREAKHQAFLASKKVRRAAERHARRRFDVRHARLEEKHPFVYIDGMFPHTFLNRPDPADAEQLDVPSTLWVVWIGDEPSPRRAEALENLRRTPGVDVRLIASPDDVLVDGHPVHPAFSDLHAVHRSDYLRAYAMHHHGGAYLDVKPQSVAVQQLIDRVNSDETVWVLGYREVTSEYVGDLPHALGAHLRAHFRAALGTSAFICRPRSLFTAEWMRELHARLDYLQPRLREADFGQGNPYSAPANYPIRWTEILGDITQPLSLKHQDHILFIDLIRPQLKDYR